MFPSGYTCNHNAFTNDGLWNACQESRQLMMKTAADRNRAVGSSKASTGVLTHFTAIGQGNIYNYALDVNLAAGNTATGARRHRARRKKRLSATGVLHDNPSDTPHFFNVFPGQDLFIFSARQLTSLGRNLVTYLRIGDETFYSDSLGNVAVEYDAAWGSNAFPAADSDDELSGEVADVLAGLGMFPGATVYVIDYGIKCAHLVARWERTGRCATAFTAREGRFVSIYGLLNDLTDGSEDDDDDGVDERTAENEENVRDGPGSFAVVEAARLRLDGRGRGRPGRARGKMPVDYDVLAYIPFESGHRT